MAGESAGRLARRHRESTTGSILDGMHSDGWAVFLDVRVPGRHRPQVGHVAVGPPGIFVIQTEDLVRSHRGAGQPLLVSRPAAGPRGRDGQRGRADRCRSGQWTGCEHGSLGAVLRTRRPGRRLVLRRDALLDRQPARAADPSPPGSHAGRGHAGLDRARPRVPCRRAASGSRAEAPARASAQAQANGAADAQVVPPQPAEAGRAGAPGDRAVRPGPAARRRSATASWTGSRRRSSPTR